MIAFEIIDMFEGNYQAMKNEASICCKNESGGDALLTKLFEHHSSYVFLVLLTDVFAYTVSPFMMLPNSALLYIYSEHRQHVLGYNKNASDWRSYRKVYNNLITNFL